MTVNMKQAIGRQTISHFLYTFMKDYDTEKAADRTMKSKYVPHNLKTQLVSAMSRCDAEDRPQIERVAQLGMFIDNSCNELVYYNTVVTAVSRWMLSLYVESTELKRVFEIIMEDVGRVCDDDIQFIMEKYRYLEEKNLLLGSPFSTSDTGLAGLLKAKKYNPDTSLMRYYGQSLWLKILRALLRNSVKAFHKDSFGSVFTGLFAASEEQDVQTENDTDTNNLDNESKALYKEFCNTRKEWFKTLAKVNSEKLEIANRHACYSDVQPPKPPPNISFTAFDVQFDNNSKNAVDNASEDDSDSSTAETVLEVPSYTSLNYLKGSSELQPENKLTKTGTTYTVASVTQEKQLKILSNDLHDVIVQKKKQLHTLSSCGNGLNCKDNATLTTSTAFETVVKNHQRWPWSKDNSCGLSRAELALFPKKIKKKRFQRRARPAALPDHFKPPALLPPPPSPSPPLSPDYKIKINELLDSSNAIDSDNNQNSSIVLFTDEERLPFSALFTETNFLN